ncbi:hypothetical protein F4801DRAFT_540001 [Xylaria longipes]|nr:hypothetical protein F4801DRAFT_540001 [Xylaria longipes]
MSESTPSNNQPEQPTFKERLDEVAREARQPTSSRENSNSPSLIEKVAGYVPGASKILGTEKKSQEQHEKPPPNDVSSPPFRPDHDEHIAEFVREQHRSKKLDGSLGS